MAQHIHKLNMVTTTKLHPLQGRGDTRRISGEIPEIRAGEPEPGVFGSLEPEPLEKKTGAGAAKKLAGSSALREDKKHKEIVL